MLPQATNTVAEVARPLTGWCASGHHVPPPEDPLGVWERGGPGTPKETIRFFHFTGQGLDGIYCEPCIVVANHMAKEKKNAGRLR